MISIGDPVYQSFFQLAKWKSPTINIEELDLSEVGQFYRFISDTEMTHFLTEEELRELIVRVSIILTNIDENLLSVMSEDTFFLTLNRLIELGIN